MTERQTLKVSTRIRNPVFVYSQDLEENLAIAKVTIRLKRLDCHLGVFQAEEIRGEGKPDDSGPTWDFALGPVVQRV